MHAVAIPVETLETMGLPLSLETSLSYNYNNESLLSHASSFSRDLPELAKQHSERKIGSGDWTDVSTKTTYFDEGTN